jgi:predicted anti-sigma-YlaC factor YlaD
VLARRRRRVGDVEGQALDEATAPLTPADVVRADAPGDGQQPRANGRVAPVGLERTDRSEVRLLHEVLDLAARAERRAHLPHRRLRLSHELAERVVVTLAGGVDERAQGIVRHAAILPEDPAGETRGNQRRVRDDQGFVACDRWIEAISAMADGEDPGLDPELVEAHVARCASCRAFRRDVAAIQGPSRVTAAPSMPDLSPRVTKLAALADRASAWSAVRVLLAVVAVEILVLSLPGLLLGEQADTSPHEARHLGAFGIAYAVALLVVVVRPARARSILPVAAILAGALLITAVVDVAQGRVPLLGETVHIPEVLSVGLVWLLATPSARRRSRTAQGTARAPELRLVERDEPQHRDTAS